MHLDLHYTDPLLVSTYDIENSGRWDVDFYLALAAERKARTIVDLGCGTGVLASDLASSSAQIVPTDSQHKGGLGPGEAENQHPPAVIPGPRPDPGEGPGLSRRVTGLDPAASMLDVARGRPGGELVTWVEGDSSLLGVAVADLVVMTGHVAQVFLIDESWAETIGDIFRALVPGGMLAFETRNPPAESWTHWTRAETVGSYELSDGNTFQSWVEVIELSGDLVTFESHTVFTDAEPGQGEEFAATSTSTLRFRTQAETVSSLEAAGFVVDQIFGDWNRSTVSPSSPELIFLAVKPARGS